MKRYSIKERIEIVQIYYKYSCSTRTTLRKLRVNYGPHNRPTEKTIRSIIQKFEDTGSVCDIPKPMNLKTAQSVDNVAMVNESANGYPNLSIRRRSQQLDLSPTSVWRILKEDLALKPYKIQLTQFLKPTDHSERRTFVDWVLKKKAADPYFCQKIIFSDEAIFHLNGFVNKQNCRIWASDNPREIKEQITHPQRVVVWCGLSSEGVIGPYFFEDGEGKACTVNGERYRKMLTDFLSPQLDNINVENLWFQQDGSTCHTAKATISLLKTKFPGRIISKYGDINWPPRSCDMTPLDFFLWGYVKSKVYRSNPQNIQHLKDNIEEVINEIGPDLCVKVINSFEKRLRSCEKSLGGHLNDIIFHV